MCLGRNIRPLVRQEGFEPSLEGFLVPKVRFELTTSLREGDPSPTELLGQVPCLCRWTTAALLPLPLTLAWDRRDGAGVVSNSARERNWKRKEGNIYSSSLIFYNNYIRFLTKMQIFILRRFCADTWVSFSFCFRQHGKRD